jgi:hypothetical protein
MSGLWSRKFILALVALFLITGVSVLACFNSAVQVNLTAFIGGIIGILTVYSGANVAAQHVAGKTDTTEEKKPNETKPEEKEGEV